MTSIRLSVPERAAKEDVIEIKALIQHPMESGFRRGARGEVIARDIITRFECIYNDETAFEAEFFPAVSANPFLSFHIKATRSGALLFRWTDQNGESWSETREIEII